MLSIICARPLRVFGQNDFPQRGYGGGGGTPSADFFVKRYYAPLLWLVPFSRTLRHLVWPQALLAPGQTSCEVPVPLGDIFRNIAKATNNSQWHELSLMEKVKTSSTMYCISIFHK